MKKLLLALAAFIAAMGFAFAAVDANTATQAELESIKGIGPAIAARILDERKKGNFKDLKDLEERVKGIGEENVKKMSAAGLSVGKGGAPKAEAKADAKTEAPKAAAKPADAKADAAKAVAKPADAKADAPKAAAKPADAKADAPKAADMKAPKADATKADAKAATVDAKTAKPEVAKADMKKDAKADMKKDMPKADTAKADAPKAADKAVAKDTEKKN